MPNDIGKRKKTKSKEYYNEGKQVSKTKTVTTPLEGGVTRNVTTTVTRPTARGYAEMLTSRNKDLSDMERTKSKTVKYTSTSTGRDFPLSPTPKPVSLMEKSKKQ